MTRWPTRLALLTLLATALAAVAQEPDPQSSEIWRKVRADLFAEAPIAMEDGVVTIEAPSRAQDGAVVPIAIRAGFAQSQARSIERIWLVIDNNPSPLAAVFRFTRASARADIETRVRIEQYTHVRAVALTTDGTHHMAVRYVKASGGCSAPPGGDARAARASLGQMLLDADTAPGGAMPVRLLVSHPNDSGLAMDQLTRTYAPAHFVRTLEVRRAGELVLAADLDFAISENPFFRFYVEPGADALEVRVVDNRELEFTRTLRVQPKRITP
jgi:sulfur-oxidizing protein SoxY